MNSQQLKQLVLILGVLLCATSLTLIFYAPIHPDAGAYLRAARLITNGAVLYKDVSCGYTPLGILLFSWVMVLIGTSAPYWQYLMFILLVQAASCAIVYLILLKLTHYRALSALGAIATMFSYYRFEGMFILLEPIVASFALLASYCLMSSSVTLIRAYLAGACCGLAFMTKQYGILYAIPLTYYLLRSQNSTKSALLYTTTAFLGITTPVVCGLVFFGWHHGIQLNVLANSLSGKHYLGAYPINPFLLIQSLIFLSPCLVLLRVLWCCRPDAKLRLKIDTLILTAVILLLPLSIRSFPHYLQLVVPWGCILTFLGLHRLQSCQAITRFERKWYLLAIGGIYCAYVIHGGYLAATSFLSNERARLIAQAKAIDSYITPNTPTMIFAPEPLCFLLNNISDPAMNFRLGVGCGFYSMASATDLTELISRSSLILADDSIQAPDRPGFFNAASQRTKGAGLDLAQHIREDFQYIQSFDDKYELWKRRSEISLTSER